MAPRVSEAQREVLEVLSAADGPMTHEAIRQARREAFDRPGAGDSPTATLQSLEREKLVERDDTPGSWFVGGFSITHLGRVRLMNLGERQRGARSAEEAGANG